MFLPRPFRHMRLVAIIGTIGLIALVSGFSYEASGLPFLGSADSATPADADTNAAGLNETVEVDQLLAAELRPVLGTGTGIDGSLTATSIGEYVAPVEVIARDGDSRTFVVEQIGRLVADSTVVLDITHRTVAEQERGFLGAAFHPSEPLLYAHYTDAAGDTVIAEYPLNDEGIADADAERIVLTADQPYENHNGGEIAFGPDGYLYIGLGDGGLANDPDRAALDLGSRFGKILRIDPSASTDGAAFTIPGDNPFVDTVGADPTVWSYGLRNPWKFSFDPVSGDLWIADVGQDLWEEINLAPATNGTDAGRGVSFGWSAYEGNERFNDDQGPDGHMAPFVTYPRKDGNCSISGGAIYRGADLVDEVGGWYIYGDFCTGTIWGFPTDGTDPAPVVLAQVDALAAVATGGDGELYAVSIAGEVFRLGL